MFFDCNEATQGDWFQFFESRVDPSTGEVKYDDPKPDAAEFCIRSTQPFWEELIGKRKKESKMVVNPQTRSMERVSYYPDQTYEELLKGREDAIDYAITGIKNAKWADGSVIECTRENKLKLRKIPAFERFLKRAWELLDSSGIKTKEEQGKNSLPSQSGDSE
jgi:hypothetical protein